LPEPLTIRVRNALAEIINPASGRNIVADGLITGLTTTAEGVVRFTLELPNAQTAMGETLLNDAKVAAAAIDGVSRVSAVATSHRDTSKPAGAGNVAPSNGHDNPLGLRSKPAIEAAAETLLDVQNIIAIASGKGGVGKSTVAANLAVSLANHGLRVGFLDADVYGPSAPILFGLDEKARLKDGKIMPFEAFGVKVMSIGFLIDPDQALAWRGPMVMGAIKQLMRDVDWGPLDIMLIDTPPGTGDAHLSLIQSKRLDGAVIVSTPQEMALADVRRGAALFRKTQTPILGVIENMAWLETATGERQYLFGEGGAERAAADIDAPFLGALALYPDLREASDSGAPLATRDHPASESFREIADKILATLKI